MYLIQKHWERIQWIKSEIKGRLKMSSLLSHSLGLEYIFQPKGIINTEVICTTKMLSCINISFAINLAGSQASLKHPT
jgi:hypothetical protein